MLIKILLFQVFLIFSASAEILQILHTNDLHGHFEGLSDEESRGGYAQLKQKISSLREKASAQGIDSLVLDGGDFSEGSVFYKAGNGLNTFKMMEMMEYDVVALGNHDYLMGPKRLEEILSLTNLPLVAANILINPLTPATRKSIPAMRMIEKGNLKIAVIGGTTNEIFYKWLFKGNIFSDPIKSINFEAKLVRGKADLVVALTHIGVLADKKLARKSKSIDLIVGGHSHTQLDKVIMANNKKSKLIPIVQAGEHGKFLGELLIEVTKVNKETKVKVLKYQLHPIFQTDDLDSRIEVYTKKSKEDVNLAMGETYLHEVLGESSIPMSINRGEQSFWASWITKTMQEETDSDIGFNSFEFFGIDQKSGPITREKIMAFYPRYFDIVRKEGWHIYTSTMSGYWISLIIDLCRKKNQAMVFSGLKFELMPNQTGELQAVNLNIDGIEIEPFKQYKVALPEGHFRGATAILPAMERILNKPEDTGISIVDAIANKIKRVGQIELTSLNKDEFSTMIDGSLKN